MTNNENPPQGYEIRLKDERYELVIWDFSSQQFVPQGCFTSFQEAQAAAPQQAPLLTESDET